MDFASCHCLCQWLFHGKMLWECTWRLPGRCRAWLGKWALTRVQLWLFQAIFAGSQHGFRVNLVQRNPPGHPSQCQPNQCTSLMSPSISEEQACAGRNIEQPKNYSFEHDPGMTVKAVIAHELLISACQKLQKGLMVVDGGTLPPGLSVTLQCPHFQAPKM